MEINSGNEYTSRQRLHEAQSKQQRCTGSQVRGSSAKQLGNAQVKKTRDW